MEDHHRKIRLKGKIPFLSVPAHHSPAGTPRNEGREITPFLVIDM